MCPSFLHWLCRSDQRSSTGPSISGSQFKSLLVDGHQNWFCKPMDLPQPTARQILLSARRDCSCLYTKLPPCQQNLIPRAAKKPWLLLHTQHLKLWVSAVTDYCLWPQPQSKPSQGHIKFPPFRFKSPQVGFDFKFWNYQHPLQSVLLTPFFFLNENSKLEGSIVFFISVFTNATVPHLVNLAPHLEEPLWAFPYSTKMVHDMAVTPMAAQAQNQSHFHNSTNTEDAFIQVSLSAALNTGPCPAL